ncbi:MAG: DNA starvation/stationary phase protection protein [Legionellales bacterium]|jgi:starvation-inducible DNA-binding protein
MKTAPLKLVLANTYALYLKTQNYHWNVTGMHFAALHRLFDEQYNELAESVDEIAEHIRMQNDLAPGSFNEFQKINKISDAKSNLDAQAMITDLLESHTLLLALLEDTLKQAQIESDEVVADFMIERMGAHKKHQWMLRSLIA